MKTPVYTSNDPDPDHTFPVELILGPAERLKTISYSDMPRPIQEEIESYRDRTWRRMPELRIENAAEAEQFVESIGFCSTLTDARRPGPSLYIAVCGRRDAYMPRNVQKDPESSLAWV